MTDLSKTIRKTVLINLSFAASSSQNFSIYTVQFIPDEMIIRGVSIYDNISASPAFILQSSLVNFDNLFSMPTVGSDGFVISTFFPLNAKFTIKKPVTGNYLFNALNLDGTVGSLNGTYVIQAEFVKY